MDQSPNGSQAPQANGATKGPSTPRASGPETQIPHALEVIHNPRSSNVLRQEASLYLEEIKSDNEAPYHGFALASEKSQPAIVRHYGLSLLEHAIRHRWTDYSPDQSAVLRGWILSLAQTVADDEPLYLRNKIGQLWVEVAKRSWALDWVDMDQLLVRLWEGVPAQKELVLVVLETLSEDIFGHEDTAAGLRGTELNKAFVEIFTPARVLTEYFPSRETSMEVRYGQEGWLSRMGDLLEWYTNKGPDSGTLQACVVAALSTLRSVMAWAIPRALAVTNCVHRICACLASSDLAVQLASVDALYSLYSRPRFQEDDFRDLVCPMYGSKIISLFQGLYGWTTVDVTNLEEDKYLLLKKFSEMVFNIGRFLAESPSLIPEDSDLSGFFNLLLSILRSQSLHVSIPILHLWTKLLSSGSIGNLPSVTAVTGSLLEICSQRLIKYEALPEDSSMPSIIFLNEDVDTIPERHAFLGNYSRFCREIVGSIVQKQPFDALYHILGQADQALNNLYEGEPNFQVSTYTRNSIPLLRLDARFSVVEAALKGYAKWMSNQAPHQNEHEQAIMNGNLQTWGERLLGLNFEDPLIKQRIVQLAGELGVGPLRRSPEFVLKVFEFTLNTHCPDQAISETYNDAVKDLQGYCSHQLQKFAMRFPDYLFNVYDELEIRLNEVFTNTNPDEHNRLRYSSVLFIITQRASTMDSKLRETRLNGFLQPTIGQWQSSELSNALSSFGGFCNLIGMAQIQQYLTKRAVYNIPNWSAHPLDDEGLSLRAQMQDVFERLPLKTTKTLLSASVEKLDRGSKPYTTACNIWQDKIPLLLPNLLQFLRHAHAFHDSSKWTELPDETRNILGRVLTDRFWQVGISSGTRDDFYATVGDTRATLEGLASSIRATMRGVRESCYRLLYYMSLLGDQFYGYGELPEPLAQALFTDACSLSTHQMAILVEMVRPIIEHCPPKHRPHFVRPMLAALFVQIERKTSMEWDRIEEKNRFASEDDNLADEMRDESILRQLTFTAVMMVMGLLDPNKISSSELDDVSDTAYTGDINLHLRTSRMRFYIISTPAVLKPIILFCTHALRVRDTRACGIVTRVMRSLIPEFSSDSAVDAEVREFISTEVLKACITSLHEPYFVDLQRDLAQLIASIVSLYSRKTEMPRQILLSLPGIPAEKVDQAIQKLVKTQNSRHQRALVLDLLEGLRGVSISEQGKIAKSDPKKIRSALQQRYMSVDVQQQGDRDETPDLGGVAEMFG